MCLRRARRLPAVDTSSPVQDRRGESYGETKEEDDDGKHAD
jgi:hypothetical protein